MSSARMRLNTPTFSLWPCLYKTEKLHLKLGNALKIYNREKKHTCKAFRQAGIHCSTVLYGESKSRKPRCQPHTLGVYSTERRKPRQPPPPPPVSANHKPSTLILSQPPSVFSHPFPLPAPLFLWYPAFAQFTPSFTLKLGACARRPNVQADISKVSPGPLHLKNK